MQREEGVAEHGEQVREVLAAYELRLRQDAHARLLIVFAATTARTAGEVAVWTAGVEEGRARSSMLIYSNALGLRASAREWSGDPDGAEADGVARWPISRRPGGGALEIARRFGAPEPIGEALRVRALLAPSEEMAERARAAVDVLAGSELRVAHARALIDLGAALRRGGHRRDAREPLREGLDLANRCGSVVETDRALDELRAAGARPRRPVLSGVESLSAQERRVAAMATDGLSNREIAEALSLTRRTIEMHLTGVYRKLDVAGREELPVALTASR